MTNAILAEILSLLTILNRAGGTVVIDDLATGELDTEEMFTPERREASDWMIEAGIAGMSTRTNTFFLLPFAPVEIATRAPGEGWKRRTIKTARAYVKAFAAAEQDGAEFLTREALGVD